MLTRIRFNMTDGDSSTWPKCGKLHGGGRMDRCDPSGDHTAQFLEKVAVQLAELLEYSGE